MTGFILSLILVSSYDVRKVKRCLRNEHEYCMEFHEEGTKSYKQCHIKALDRCYNYKQTPIYVR